MQKYQAYYFNDFGDRYTAESEADDDGLFYLASDVDARIAELEAALQVPTNWSQEVADLLVSTYDRKREAHGLRETLFGVVAAYLRHKNSAL